MALSIDQLNYVLDQLPSLTTGQTAVINALANTPIGGVIVCTYQLNYVLDQLPPLTNGQPPVISALSNTPIGGVIVRTTNQPGPVKCHQSALRALETAGWILLTKNEGGYLTLPSKRLMAIITLAKVIHPREPILT